VSIPNNLQSLFPEDLHRSSPITHLMLWRCGSVGDRDGEARMPIRMLPAFKALKSLIIEDAYSKTSEQALSHHTAVDLELAMRLHILSLEEFIFSYSSIPVLRDISIISLNSYHRMKRLCIPEVFLAANQHVSLHETLPQSLEELQLQYCLYGGFETNTYARERSNLETILNVKEKLPALRLVVIWYKRGRATAATLVKHWPHQFRMDLTRKAEVAQVSLVWTTAPDLSETPFGSSFNPHFIFEMTEKWLQDPK
jgi:hypothetical protein